MNKLRAWYLKNIDLFKGLSNEKIDEIAACFTHMPYEPKSEIRGLDQKDKIFLLKQGVVEVYAITSGGKKVILELLGPGSIFSALSGFDNDLDIHALVRKRCVICTIDTEEFFTLISQYPKVAQKLMRSLYSRVLSNKERLFSLAVESVPQRLKRLIRMFSTEFFDTSISFTHEEMAQMIGASRQTLTTVLNQLIKQNVIKKTGKKYQLIADL